MKNCLMLELRLLGYRLAMPDLCRQAKIIWRDIPQEVKNKYDHLALQAQILHQEMYPNYRFAPKKRTTFKPYNPMINNGINNGINTFTVTSVKAGLSSSTSGPVDSPLIKSQHDNIYLLEEQPEQDISNFIHEIPPHENDIMFPLPELDFRDPLLDQINYLNWNVNLN
jgi:hypothetical protein